MVRVNESEKEYRNGDSGVKYLHTGPMMDLGIMLLLPGEKMGGHYHEEIEEIFYFPQGGATIIINGEKLDVHAGDSFRMQPKDTHDIMNNTEAPIKIIFMKAPSLPKDKISC